MTDMHELDSAKIITAVLPKEVDAIDLIHRLKDEKGVSAVNLNYGRGMGRFTNVRDKHLGDVLEKEILTIVIDAARADEVFAFVYEVGRIGRAHGGIMYQQPLRRASDYRLPDVMEETS